jgi:fumarate hydratase class II
MKGNDGSFRIERDSTGEIRVPKGAYFGAQTKRAGENFRISGLRFPRVFVRALGLTKRSSAQANGELLLLSDQRLLGIRWSIDSPDRYLSAKTDPITFALNAIG